MFLHRIVKLEQKGTINPSTFRFEYRHNQVSFTILSSGLLHKKLRKLGRCQPRDLTLIPSTHHLPLPNRSQKSPFHSLISLWSLCFKYDCFSIKKFLITLDRKKPLTIFCIRVPSDSL